MLSIHLEFMNVTSYAVAVSRENADLEKRYQQILKQNATLQSLLSEKEQNLEKMRSGKLMKNKNMPSGKN